MQSPQKFKSLSELVNELSALLSEEEITLSLEELENANQLARDISERLIVLRHKAYEKFVGRDNQENIDIEEQISSTNLDHNNLESTPESETEISTPFFQMSLIDAIEEASSIVEENKLAEIESIGIEDAPIETQDAGSEQTLAKDDAPHFIASELEKVGNTKADEFINASAANANQPITLADKHQFDKIEDLKRAITLNQRFQFSRELFKGNNQEYEVAIDRLNNSSREEALLMLRDLRAKFDWHEESSAAIDLYGLVERRYSSL